ncbi:MAG TPA: hypothetical protein VNA25_02830 [Phycisphaerae bacterium]|nr:hypothetical protein [Phycisphaerae bacterium]
MNIKALQGPLKFGDQEQIKVLNALKAGWHWCKRCGDVFDPKEEPDQPDPQLCPECNWADDCAEDLEDEAMEAEK